MGVTTYGGRHYSLFALEAPSCVPWNSLAAWPEPHPASRDRRWTTGGEHRSMEQACYLGLADRKVGMPMVR